MTRWSRSGIATSMSQGFGAISKFSRPRIVSPRQTRVFGRLFADLQAIDLHNAVLNNVSDPANLYAHIFLYEATEAVALQNAVKRHLDDPRVRIGLLHMVRLFPPDEVVPEPEFRGMQHLPATALRSVVEQLLSLPVMVMVRARLDITGAGNGPSPRRRAARVASVPTIHHSGWPVSNSTSWAFSVAVSAPTAASPNRAGSNGRVSVMAFSSACEAGTISSWTANDRLFSLCDRGRKDRWHGSQAK
jgi:hypothetical protein